ARDRGGAGGPALLPPHRGGNAAGRPEPREGQARLGAEDHAAGTGARDGQRRLRLRPPRQSRQARRVPGLRLQRVSGSAAMKPDARIYVAGHRGLVGSALVRRLESTGHTQLLKRTHAELDLTDAAQTQAFFDAERPEYV